MKVNFILLFLSAMTVLNGQEVKQITFSNNDCRHPVFVNYPLNMTYFNPGSDSTEIIFEQSSGNSINLCYARYNISTDSFYQPIRITDNNFINRNAACKFIGLYSGSGYKALIWETNQNGNWDIAYSADSGSGWSAPQLLLSSNQNETKAAFVYDPLNIYYDSLQIVYQINNSVYLYSGSNTNSNIALIFHGDLINSYSSPTAAVDAYGDLYVAAIKKTIYSPPKLVFKTRTNQGEWSSEQILYDSLFVLDAKFFEGFDLSIAITVFENNLKKVLLMNSYDFGNNWAVEPIVDETNTQTSDFSTYVYYIITNQPRYWSPYPFAYWLLRNDSAYTVTGLSSNGNYDQFKEIYTKVRNTKISIGPLGGTIEGEISYTVWEDSSYNNINLFGIKRIDVLADVKEKKNYLPGNVQLYQNYPNPFNPITNIGFRIANFGFITLKVYDILGREVTTLVNEEKKPGTYDVNFDASQLSSGIYFYRLKAGSFIQAKKMILLK